MPPHERKKPAIFSAFRIEQLPGFKEVMIHESNDMESVGNDQGIGEVRFYNLSVGIGQIHYRNPSTVALRDPL